MGPLIWSTVQLGGSGGGGGGAPSGPAGGVLGGTYPNPTLDSTTQSFLLARANHTGTQAATSIVEDSTHRFATDAEKTLWNAAVPSARTLTAGTGLSGGGDLSANRSLALANTAVTAGSYTNANITVDAQGRITLAANGSGGGGSVSSVFGRTGVVVATSGDYTTAQVTESGSLYFTNARAIAATLTGYTSGAGTISSSDTILGAIQKLNGNVAALVTGVSSVFGRTGAVVATSGDYTTAQVTESGSLYFTNARAIAATLTGYTSGTGTISSSDSVLSAIQKLNGNVTALVTGVSSVFGRTGAVVATSGDYTTAQVTESGSLYFTNARAIASTLTGYTSGAGTISSSDSVLSAIQKLNGNDALRALLTGATFSGAISATNLSGTNTGDQTITLTGDVTGSGTGSFAATLANTTVSAGSYTNANITVDAKGRITAATNGSAGGVTSLNSLTGALSIAVGTSGSDFAVSAASSTVTLNLPTASASNRGALSSADWSTFNGKQSALTIGNLTEATSSVLTITGGTAAIIGSGLSIQVKLATTSVSGYLSSTDWNTFNNKQAALTLGNLTEATSSVLTITGGTGAIVGSGLSIQVKLASTSQAGYLASADFTTFNNKIGAVSNLGASGASVYSGLSGTTAQLRKIIGGDGITATENTNDITLSTRVDEATFTTSISLTSGVRYQYRYFTDTSDQTLASLPTPTIVTELIIANDSTANTLTISPASGYPQIVLQPKDSVSFDYSILQSKWFLRK